MTRRCRLRAPLLAAPLAAALAAALAGDWATLAQLAPVLVLAIVLATGCFPGEHAIARARARRLHRGRPGRALPRIGHPRPARRTAVPQLGSLAAGFALRPPPAPGATAA